MADYSNPRAEKTLRSIAQSVGYNAWLALDLIAAGNGKCEVAIDVTEHMRQHHGVTHGGIVGSLADTASAWAAATLAGDVVTASYNLQLLGPGRAERLLARAEVLKQGRRSVSATSKIFDVNEGGEECLIAVSLASIHVVGVTD